MNNSFEAQVEKLCSFLYDKKAIDIISINITDKSIIADYFIVCSGRSNTQVKAICDDLEATFGAELNFRRKEGYQEGRWIVVDFGDILLHIFHPEERKYYNIERLWADDNNLVDYSAKMENETTRKEPSE